MYKLHYITYIPPQVIKSINLRDKDNLRRKDKSAVPKVSFLRRFHCISALWKPSSPSNSRHSSSPEIRIGHVQYILKHYITTEQGQMQHLIAVVNWFKKHPQEMYFGSSCYIVRTDVETGNSTIIPVQRVLSRCCFGNVTIHPPSGPETVIVPIPIPFKYCI